MLDPCTSGSHCVINLFTHSAALSDGTDSSTIKVIPVALPRLYSLAACEEKPLMAVIWRLWSWSITPA